MFFKQINETSFPSFLLLKNYPLYLLFSTMGRVGYMRKFALYMLGGSVGKKEKLFFADKHSI